MELKIIARIRTDFPEKFGLPRQSGLVGELGGKIVFEPEYSSRDALRGLEGYSHIWIIWGFSERFASRSGKNASFSPTVRPPRLGGNKRVGVFATRSPNRPNPIALSVVKLDGIGEDGSLSVSGIDMTDMTPVYDIKPYLPHIDSVPDARGGFACEVSGERLEVVFPDEFYRMIPAEKRSALVKCLADDPRPQYQNDGREYFMSYAGYDVVFGVKDGTLTVTSVSAADGEISEKHNALTE